MSIHTVNGNTLALIVLPAMALAMPITYVRAGANIHEIMVCIDTDMTLHSLLGRI